MPASIALLYVTHITERLATQTTSPETVSALVGPQEEVYAQ